MITRPCTTSDSHGGPRLRAWQACSHTICANETCPSASNQGQCERNVQRHVQVKASGSSGTPDSYSTARLPVGLWVQLASTVRGVHATAHNSCEDCGLLYALPRPQTCHHRGPYHRRTAATTAPILACNDINCQYVLQVAPSRLLETDPYDALTGESQLHIILVLPDQHGARPDSRLLWTGLPAVDRSSVRAWLDQHSTDSPSSRKQESARNLMVAANDPQKRCCAIYPRQIRP